MEIKNKPSVDILGENHCVVYMNGGAFLISYKSILLYAPIEGKIQLSKKWNYSRSSGYYRNLFLKEGKAITKRKLKTGEYELNESL